MRKVPLTGLDAVLAEVRDAKTLIGLLLLARRLERLTALAPAGNGPGFGRNSGHGNRGATARADLRVAHARLPRLSRVRAGPLAQHARGLPGRPAPVRPLPRGAQDAYRRPGRRRRRVPVAAGRRRRARCGVAGHRPPQGRLPALLLPAPATRGRDGRRPHGGADPAPPVEEASARPDPAGRSGSCRAAARHRSLGAPRPRPARGDVRLRPPRVGGDRARYRGLRPRGRGRAGPGQGLEGAPGPGRPEATSPWGSTSSAGARAWSRAPRSSTCS